MSAPDAHIALLRLAAAPAEVFDDVLNAWKAPGLKVEVRAQDQGGVFAASEWLLPTAVAVFVTQGYFSGFLSEIGKDHYSLVKSGLQRLARRFAATPSHPVGRPARRPRPLIFSPGFSIYAQAPDGTRIKFLLPVDNSVELAPVLDAIADLMLAMHLGVLPPRERDMIERQPVYGGILLLAYNPSVRRIERVNPITGSFEPPDSAS